MLLVDVTPDDGGRPHLERKIVRVYRMFCRFLNYEKHIIRNPNFNTTNELRNKQ
jgi:hypothetical protein